MADINTVTPMPLEDLYAAQPGAVVETACAPSRQSELSGAEVVEVAELLGIDFAAAPFSIEELQTGMEVELELGYECTPSMVDVIDDDLIEIGKVAVANLQERSDYYSQLTQAHAPGDLPICTLRNVDVGGD